MTGGTINGLGLEPAAFARLAERLGSRYGFELRPEKAYLLETRLGPVARRFGCADVAGLLQRAAADPPPDLERAVAEALATHETSFFRDLRVFTHIRRVVLPALFEARSRERRIRVWSAAASTGQEAYSLAMCFAERQSEIDGWQIEIVGTDFVQTALNRAERGVYSSFEVQRGVPAPLLVRFFERDGQDFRVRDVLRRMVRFVPHNLLHSPRAFGRFDLVLIRNVLIYMDRPTRRRVLEHVHTVLAEDGWLVVGATEHLSEAPDLFVPEPGAHAFFRRAPAAHAVAAKTSVAASRGAASPA